MEYIEQEMQKVDCKNTNLLELLLSLQVLQGEIILQLLDNLLEMDNQLGIYLNKVDKLKNLLLIDLRTFYINNICKSLYTIMLQTLFVQMTIQYYQLKNLLNYEKLNAINAKKINRVNSDYVPTRSSPTFILFSILKVLILNILKWKNMKLPQQILV